jgi:hypothetical protein
MPRVCHRPARAESDAACRTEHHHISLRRNGCRGAGPCQALAAEGGGRKARLDKGQPSPATSPPADRWAATQDHALALPIRNLKEPIFQAKILYTVKAGEPMTVKKMRPMACARSPALLLCPARILSTGVLRSSVELSDPRAGTRLTS